LSAGTRVVVHIGSDKAGSKAIQESLFANRDWYLERGVFIPETGLHRGAGHPSLFNALGDDNVVSELQAETRELRCPTAALSFEGLHFWDDGPRQRLAAVLERTFPGAELVFLFYVRNQVDLIQSGVLQQIKQLSIPPSTVHDLNQPLDRIPRRSRRFLAPSARFTHKRVKAWRKTFPGAEMVVRLYRRDRLVRSDILDDFHDVLGLGPDASLSLPTRSANPSLTAEAAVVLDRVWGFTWNHLDRKRIVDVLMSYPDGSGSFLHEDTREAILEHYREDNLHLLKDFPECEGIQEPTSRARPEIEEDAVDRCHRFLGDQSTHPTVMVGRLRGAELAHLHFDGGWDHADDSGAWAVGPSSVLRFRPRVAHATGYSENLTITLEGLYQGYRAQSDDVVVNGRSLGALDVTSVPLVVPLCDLGPSMNVDLELRHDIRAARRPGADAEARKTFLLQSLAYSIQ